MRTHSVSIVLTTLLLVGGLTIAPFATLGPAVGTATAQEGFNVTDSAEVEINEDGSFNSTDLNSTDAGFPNSYAGDPGAVTVNGEDPPPGLTLTAQADQPEERVRFLVDGEVATVINLTDGDSEFNNINQETISARNSRNTQLVTLEANLEIFDVAINDAASTTDVLAGEDAIVNATIENTGDETATQTIDFTVNGTTEDSVEVTDLAGGATETVEFSYPTELADDGATATVASGNDTATRTLSVTEPAPPNFNVTINNGASTTDVIAGEDAVINATIENIGDETGTQTIDFSVNGTTEDSVEVTDLAGGATETVEFTYSTELADDGATAAVTSDNDTDSSQLSVGAPANVSVSITDAASTTSVTAGEDAVINATVENTGDETATQTIDFSVNGTTEDSVEVTDLAGGATETVEFTYSTELADDGATTTVASDDDSASRTLSVAPAPPNFTVSINAGASTTDVIAGEDAVINATIENTGDETGTQTIEFTVNDTTEDSVEVTDLAGGATETVEFTYTTELADDGATAAVASDNATDSSQLSVGAPADFSVSITDAASTTSVTAGENAVINATIENTGDETATQTIDFSVNGTTEDSVEVTDLAGGATETVEFTYSTELADDGATAAVASNDDSASRTLSVAPAPANFTVSINNGASTTDVIAGEDAVINATIENTGDETATQTINFTVNGTNEDSVEVTDLAGGATETVEFTYTTELADDGAIAAVASDNATDDRTLTVGAPANFSVSITDAASTTDVIAGEDAVINATIENTGDETATQTINFTVNGTVENSTEVTLDGGDTDTVTFSYTTELADDGATTAVTSDNDTATETLSVGAPANFAVSVNDAASITSVTAGEDAVINATIENTGDETATQTVTFTVNGSDEDSVEVTDLNGGATETVEFTYSTELADDGATAAVTSDDATDDRTLTVAPAPANFTVTIDDAASTTDVIAGEDAIVNATIENTGDETATQTIDFTVNGSTEDSVEVTDLAGGATDTVEFTYTTELADDGATAEVASDNDTATQTLSVGAPANFTVSINDAASTTDVTAGEDAVINATIENTGDETATQAIDFTVNGSDEDSVEVADLAGGATDTVEFTYTTELADDGATAEVASDDDTDSRTLNVTEPAPANFAVTVNDGASTTDVTAGEDAVINATIENTGDETGTQTINFTVNDTAEDSVDVTDLAGGATETVEFTYTTELADDGATATVASDNDTDSSTLTVEEQAQPDPEPQGSVTFNNQTVPNGTEQVTVASANYTLADGTPGDYVVVTHVVGDEFEGGLSDPVGYSSNLTGEAADITVDLNASEAQGDALDTLTENTTLRAMLHETSSNSAFGPSLGLATDDATITVEDDAQPDPEPQGSVTFNNQTVPNGTEQVTVANANYTLADGTPGDYVVVAHVVNDDGSISSPVGYSSNLTGEAADITVDLNASEAQGDALDTLTENTTLRAMLHETSSNSAFGPSLGLATDDATITVEDDEPPAPDPATANLTTLDIAGQGDTARLTPGAERNVTVTLANTGGEQGTFAVALNITANGTTAGTETQEVSLASGANTTVTFENVTGDLAADEYNLTVTAAESAVTGSLTVKAAPAAIGGDENATAQDVDDDGTFEDVNGDGNFTVADVFELFNNQDAVPEDDTAAFDFNNDSEFNVLDVQRLLNQQQEGS